MPLTRKRNKKTRRALPMALAVMVAAVCVVSFSSLDIAQGSDPVSADTVGLGELQSSSSSEVKELPSSKMKAGTEGVSDAVSSADTLKRSSSRTITVEDPDPCVAVVAYDASNEEAVRAAQEIGEINPLPTAPRIAPDTSGPEWQTGMASAYDLDTNQGWDATALGVKLTPTSVTVAVPESQDCLLGRLVEIVYEDQVVVATITDTGGFEKYGRALDLAGGVWKAFGSETWGEWGVREVKYRFL